MPRSPRCLCGDCRLCRGREASRRYIERNRKAQRAAHKAWRQTPAGKAWAKARRRRDRLKIAARNAVNNALRDGRLERGECEHLARGDCSGRIEGHHDDYGKPLEVRWLCRRHHAEADREREERAA